MKLLLDQNLSFKLCNDLADVFPDANHVGLLDLAGSDDHAIWKFAKDNAYTIVSQDADFAEMAALYGLPPKVIWIRAGNQPTVVIARLLRFHAEIIAAFEHEEAVCLEIYGSFG